MRLARLGQGPGGPKRKCSNAGLLLVTGLVLVEMLVTRRRLMGAAVTWTGFEVSRQLGIEGVGDVR